LKTENVISLNLYSGGRFDHTSIQARLDTILLVETAAYIMCEEKPIDPVVFQRIMTSRNVPSRIFRMADSNNDGQLNVEELMAFLITISMPRLVCIYYPIKIRGQSFSSELIAPIMTTISKAFFFSTLSWKNAILLNIVCNNRFVCQDYLQAKSLLHKIESFVDILKPMLFSIK